MVVDLAVYSEKTYAYVHVLSTECRIHCNVKAVDEASKYVQSLNIWEQN